MCAVKENEERVVDDGDLENWFESDWLSDNLRTVISCIKLPPQPEPVIFDADSKYILRHCIFFNQFFLIFVLFWNHFNSCTH